ncbi:hypothetical protein Tco_0929976 [Tanacetum coccineum]
MASCMMCDAVSRLYEHKSSRVLVLSFSLSEVGFHDRLTKLRPVIDAYALALWHGCDSLPHGMEYDSLPLWHLAFMAWNVIACIHGMECDSLPSWYGIFLHDMVDKLSLMAWLLACLCGMDGKVSEIESKARNDEIRNVKFIDTGSMKEKMKM